MRIAVTGASGLVGASVTDALRQAGHEVTRMVRARAAARAPDAIFWDPATRTLDPNDLAGHQAVVNLAGENIAGIWTPAKKRRLYHSRVDGTTLIATTMAGIPEPMRPRVLLNASAMGYYGDRPANDPVTEAAPPGEGFMARLVHDWEAAADPARAVGIRVLHLRFGLVLDPDALLIRAIRLATRLGLGATLGNGAQPFSWVTTPEIGRVILFLLDRNTVHGPVNVVAPDPTTFLDFVDTVARVLRRPRFLRIPRFVVRAIGGLGDEVLSGARLVPAQLAQAGYEWRDPALEPALRRIL